MLLDADNLRALAVGKMPGQYRIPCPSCGPTRHNKTDRSLSLLIDADTVSWQCWHCSQTGKTALFEQARPVVRKVQTYPLQPVKPVPVNNLSDLSDSAVKWLASRGIGAETATKFGVRSTVRYFSQVSGEIPALAFPHRQKTDIIAVKFRALEGKFFSAVGKQETYWGQEYVEPGKPLVITEGELDALSVLHCGIPNAISVPAGAPRPRVAVVGSARDEAHSSGHETDTRLGYILQADHLYDECGRVVIFTDNDIPGLALAEELARRIGKHRCYQVAYPEGCKDANDILIRCGPDRLRSVIDEARPWPVAGLYDADHYWDKLYDLYQNGTGSGFPTGLPSINELFSIVPGQLSIVTGTPGSGKSAFIDQLAVNLVRDHGWQFCMASFENPPQFHLIKLIENYTGKPFYGGSLPRIDNVELDEARIWAQRNFSFIESADGLPATMDMILERARIAVMRHGIRGLVIDPYNYIDKTAQDKSETEYVSDLLTKVRRFAVGHDVHTWLIAHPHKMMRGEDGSERIPGGYDISGSAHWFNKADLGMTVHRYKERHQALVRLWKVRFKWVGQIGDALLNYDTYTGRYSDGDRPKAVTQPSRYWNED